MLAEAANPSPNEPLAVERAAVDESAAEFAPEPTRLIRPVLGLSFDVLVRGSERSFLRCANYSRVGRVELLVEVE